MLCHVLYYITPTFSITSLPNIYYSYFPFPLSLSCNIFAPNQQLNIFRGLFQKPKRLFNNFSCLFISLFFSVFDFYILQFEREFVEHLLLVISYSVRVYLAIFPCSLSCAALLSLFESLFSSCSLLLSGFLRSYSTFFSGL